MAAENSTLPKLPETGHPISTVSVILITDDPKILEIINEIEGYFPEEAIIDTAEYISDENVKKHNVIIFLNLSSSTQKIPQLGCYCIRDGKQLSILECEENKTKRGIVIKLLTALKTELSKID